jgi:hypothetical protein
MFQSADAMADAAFNEVTDTTRVSANSGVGRAAHRNKRKTKKRLNAYSQAAARAINSGQLNAQSTVEEVQDALNTQLGWFATFFMSAIGRQLLSWFASWLWNKLQIDAI